MKRPTYELEDYRYTYEYHRQFRANKAFARSAYWLMHKVMQPNVTYEPGTQATLENLHAEAAPQIFALNHLSNLHDQSTAAAVAHEALPQYVGDIRVLAKDGFYNGELLLQLNVPSRYQRFIQPVMTPAINHLGTTPVSRTKNHRDKPKLAAEANEYMFDMLADLLEDGTPIAGFFESTHNYQHPPTNLPLRDGLARLVLRTLKPGRTPAAVIPIGISYGRDYEAIGEGLEKPNRIRRPQAHIGEVMVAERGMEAADITALAAAKLQAATDTAFAAYDQRTT